MSEPLAPIGNPADLARPYAEAMGFGGEFGAVTDKEEALLVRLEHEAAASQTIGTYFVEANRALSIPVSFEADGPVNFIDFFNLAFEAPFTTFSVVQVGRIVGFNSVRALCVAFNKAFLLPYFDHIPNDHLLHVPVLAVESMERTE